MPALAQRTDLPRKRYSAPTAVQELEAGAAFGPDYERASALVKLPRRVLVAGDAALLHAPRRVAVVGSRDASDDGLKRARRIGRLLAEGGVVVVSGLAKGIDSAAHLGAIDAGGRTIAVIGTPLDKAYPAENAALQERIWRDHALVSEFPAGTRTFPSAFVDRNRTMAALSHASVVVEAGETSGSLYQVRAMQELGRPVFVMRSLMGRGLKWPESFVAHGGVHVLEDAEQVLAVLPQG